MRFVGKVFLIVSFILSYLVLLICITAKFQLLDSNFWIQSFRQGNVYEKLEGPLTLQIENTFVEEGASKRDAALVASVLAKDSLQDLVEKNAVNFLDYINNKVQNLIIFFPINKLPGSIRESLELNSNEFSLDYLLSTFGPSSTPIGKDLFTQLRSLGSALTISLVVAIISQIITLYAIYKLENKGERLYATGVSFILSGVLTLVLIIFINQYTAGMAKELATATDASQILLLTLTPPLVLNMLNVWIIISLITIAIGIGAIFVRRPGEKLQVRTIQTR